MSQSSVSVAAGFAQPDLKLYARLAWRWLWLVVLCAGIGGGAAFFVSLNMTPIYQAASKVMINEARTRLRPTITTFWRLSGSRAPMPT